MMATYFIHSGVRKRHTATKRRLAPVNAALVQHIGGFIVRRTRPVAVSAETVMRLLPQLKVAEAEGRLELRTPAGRLVNLDTLTVMAEDAVDNVADTVSVPQPNFLPDSAARDTPAGENLPIYPEGTGAMQDTEAPSLIEPSPGESEPPVDKVPTLVKNRNRGGRS